jgi:hypothetical protein
LRRAKGGGVAPIYGESDELPMAAVSEAIRRASRRIPVVPINRLMATVLRVGVGPLCPMEL